MKRFFTFLTVLFLLLPGITACGRAPATLPSPTDAIQEPTELATPQSDSSTTVQPFNPLPGKAEDILPQPIPLPIAVLVDTRDGLGLSLYDRSGLALGEWAVSPPVPGRGHVAGSIADGIPTTPLVLVGSGDEPGVTYLRASLGGNTSPLFEIPQPMEVEAFIGVPGQPFIAFSTFESISDGSVIRCRLYVGDYKTLSLERPALVVDSSESVIYTPVAIRMGFEKPEGLWYTTRMWGVGGDMFSVRDGGLYYLDLASGTSSEYLLEEQAFSNLSTSQMLVTWMGSPGHPLSVTNLLTGETITFPLLPDSERGAAQGLISPGDYYVAWLEGKGFYYDENLEVTLRIGTTEGFLIADYPSERFAKPSGLGVDVMIYPVGWVSDELLLVATYSQPEDEGALVLLNVSTGELSPFRAGFFAGFAYP